MSPLFELGAWLPLLSAWALALVMAALALWRPGASLRGSTRAMSAGLAFAAAGLAWWSLPALELDGGHLAFGGAAFDDRFARALDAGLLVLVGLGAVTSPRRAGARGVALLALGAVGASVCAHANSILGAWMGLELAGVAASLAWELGGGAERSLASVRLRLGRRFVLASVLGWLGIALMYGGIGAMSLDDLGSRVARVLTQWGGAQRFLELLQTGGEALPAGIAAQAKGRLASGMAPAAMLLPGLLAFSAALWLRLFGPGTRLERGVAVPHLLASIAVFAVAARVLVAGFHAPRLVNEPYAWTGPLPLVCALVGVHGCVRAWRARSLGALVRALVQVQLALICIDVVLAANFYGHRALIGRQLALVYEAAWATTLGDRALAAGLAVLLSSALSAWLCFVAIERIGLDRVNRIRGLARRDRSTFAMVAVGLLGLAGVPGTFGFAALFASLRALVEHSELRVSVLFVMAAMVACALAVLRVLAEGLAAREPEDAPASKVPFDRARIVLAAAVAALLLAAGLRPEPIVSRLDAAATGMSYVPGGDARLRWDRESRARRAAGGALPGKGRRHFEDDPFEAAPVSGP